MPAAPIESGAFFLRFSLRPCVDQAFLCCLFPARQKKFEDHPAAGDPPKSLIRRGMPLFAWAGIQVPVDVPALFQGLAK